MHHDTGFIGLSFDGLGGEAKILPPELRQTCWEAKWARKCPRESPEYTDYVKMRIFFEAKPLVTTESRQAHYFGSKRAVSGTTFSADF